MLLKKFKNSGQVYRMGSIYRAGLHQQKLSTVVLPNNQPLQNGMNNRKILNNQEKNKQINKKNWNTLKETYSFK